MVLNGQKVGIHPILGGAATSRQPRPVVGRVRARITRPLSLEPNISGRYGRAWSCNLDTARLSGSPGQPPDATVALWVMELPWSHQVVHSLLLGIVHLRYLPGRPRPEYYLEGATHEVHLFGLHPEADRAHLVLNGVDPRMLIRPPMFAAQMICGSDDEARTGARRAVWLACDGKLGSRPEHMRAWAEVFGDNMLRHALAPEEEP